MQAPFVGPPSRARRRLLTLAATLAIATLSHPAVPSGQGGPGPIGATSSLATYLGSELNDGIVALETDAAGNLFVFGTIPDGATFVPWMTSSFIGPQSLTAPNDCFLAKLIPDPASNFLAPEYFALIHDSERCEAMAIAPTGDAYVARTIGDSAIVIEQYSNASGTLQRTNSFNLPHVARVTHLRVDDFGNSIVVGECANEANPGDLWPLPNGYQIGPAGVPSPCVDAAQAGQPGGQYLMVKVVPDGQVVYGSFFGFGTSQIDPTSVEIDPLGRVYIAGHTNVGVGPTILTTFNAFMLQPGDAFCTPNTSDCEGGDAFLIVFDPRFQSNQSYAYASYLGGTDRESDVAMALAPDGRVHLIGNTQSSNSFPGMLFSTPSAIFDLVIDPNQTPVNQLVRSGTIVEGHFDAHVLYPHESSARFRLRPNGTYALLALSDDPAFPLVEPLFSVPRDPSAFVEMKARLLVYSPGTDDLVLSTYLDDVTLGHRAHLASSPGGTLYVSMVTTEAGRSTSTTEISGDDVLTFAIDGIGVTTNHPPFADAGADQTFFASTPAGTRVLLYGGFSFDQDNDPLTYEWSEGTTALASESIAEVVLTPGVHTITLTVDDGQGGVASDTVTMTVLPNTPAGGTLPVTLEDSAWVNFGIYNRYPLTVESGIVTTTGFTSVTSRSPLPPVPPPGMQFGSPPHVYDVATTATVAGPFTVCADYRGMSFATPASQLQVYQQINGAWVALPQTNDVSARRICGTAQTLGTFGLFTPAMPANEISLLAGQPGRSSACFPPAGPAVQGPDPNEGGLATDSSLCVTRGLAHDPVRNYLYFSEATAGDKIRRVDLATNRITTVAGTGFKTSTLDGPGGDLRDDDKNNVDPLTAPIDESLALALDAAGNVVFAEYGPHGGRIRKLDFAQSRLFTLADVGTFSRPSALAIDSSGAALFAGFADGTPHIWRLSAGADGVLDGSPDETLQIVGGTGEQFFDVFAVPAAGIDPLQIGTPAGGLAFGPDGSLYVAVGLGLPSLLRITPGPDGLVDGNGDTLFHVSGVGTLDPILGDGNSVRNSRMFSPWSVAVAQNGDVYVGDGGHYQAASVRRITAGADGVVTGAADEIISTVAGFHIFDPNINENSQLPYSDGDGHALSSIFAAAWDLEVLPNNDLLITDSFQVRRVGPRQPSGDTTPPALTLPSNIVAEAQDPNGAIVTFVASALDDIDGVVAVNCSQSSGTLFTFVAPGPTATTVSCTATDASGNVATGTFTVTVQDTMAPSVTAHPPIQVAATEAAGARANVPVSQAPDTAVLLAFLAAGSATDLADVNPQRLATQRVVCADPATVLDTVVEATLFTVGENCVDVAFTDASGNVGHAIAVVTVLPPVGGHVNVAGIAVAATDLNNNPVPVTTTFVFLQQPGLVTAVGTSAPGAAPSGLTLSGPVFDIRSTALPTAAVVVCLQAPVQSSDRLLWWDGGTWVDRTANVDVANAQICGVPALLGIFAIGQPSVAMVTVTERIMVRDAPMLRPSALVGISERIAVRDVSGVVPPAVVAVIERIAVADTPRLLPAAMVGVSEQIAVRDAPLVTAIDEIAPVLTVPGTTVAEAETPAGAVVTFVVTATDNLPAPVNVVCSPQSGSVFPFNGSSPTTTPVSCTATDGAGNTATAGFDVVVRDTTPPQVFTAQLTVAATEASGARGNVPQAPHTPLLQQIPLLAGVTDAGDQNPARVSVQWVACGNPAQVLGPIVDTTLYPVGMNCFLYVFRDASGNVGTGTGTIEVSPPIGGHINVPNVPVTATDLNNVPQPVTVTFLALDQPGLLTAVPPQFIPQAPAGMILVGAPLELHSTALSQGPAVVCMRPPFGDAAERLMTLEFFQWVDRTETVNPSGEICGRPGELGTFALVRRDMPIITSLTPSTAVAGSAGLEITVTGIGFDSGATAFWNGSPRPTVVHSMTQLSVAISTADLATAADVTTVSITVINPGSVSSNPLPFVIAGLSVLSVDARVASPGEGATASNAPNQPAQHGVTATLNNVDGGSPPATVAVASYGTNPVGDGLFAAGGFFDIQVTGADAADSLTARFYYPSTVVGSAENNLQLLYWNGVAWLPVTGSGGSIPLKDLTDDLDGTISGGRFTVVLDITSNPTITNLSGTVFALVEETDLVGPVTTLEQSPPPNAHGWNNTDVAVTLAATDNLSGVARTEFTVNGGAWQTYDGPIVLRHSGIYTLAYRSVDVAGNVETAKTTRVKIDKTPPLAIAVALPGLLLPANGRMVDITVFPLAVDLFSSIDKLTLVSVTSNDPGMSADDVAGWTIGTKDTSGKLRAERTASGGRRIYTLTYRATDHAGNEAVATALVIVP